ncbi:MAG: ORF6N domain-containing protein [Calditrichia bacterium]|nr:ORF6N domain-containing protein [Calditrichia bacterium]
MKTKVIIQPVRIEKSILLIRGEKVLIDTDLASFYGVSTKRLNEQVRRNRNRFPEDFIFQLNQEEKNEVVANCDHLNNLKYSKSLPYVFTEHDDQLFQIIQALKQLLKPDLPPKRYRIGFQADKD